MNIVQIAKAHKLEPGALVDHIRCKALSECISRFTQNVCERNSISLPSQLNHVPKSLESFIKKASAAWMVDHKFHLKNRINGTQKDDLDYIVSCFDSYKYCDYEDLRQYFQETYDLSVLPIHISQHCKNALSYFLPPMGFIAKPDPYSIKESKSAVLAKSAKYDGKIYVATRHPDYATYLFTLTVPSALDPTKGSFLCPVGCYACYRGAETRNKRSIRVTDTQESLFSSKIKDQTTALINSWESGVNDILISGGEPLLFSNRALERDVLSLIKEAVLNKNGEIQNLKSLRICTGALGLGLFARFDDDLLDMLSDFQEETGIQIGINAHIAHPENFTPEMIEVCHRIKKRMIRIMPQVPLVENVNFFNHNADKTYNIIARIADLSYFVLGVPVYKFIVDMQGSVSLLQALNANRMLFEVHKGRSNIVRPTSFELFVEESGINNVNLSFHTLRNLRPEYDGEVVHFFIEHAAGSIVKWTEPHMLGVNDQETFRHICE